MQSVRDGINMKAKGKVQKKTEKKLSNVLVWMYVHMSAGNSEMLVFFSFFSTVV